MITDREILRLADEVHNDFLSDYLIDCKFEVLPLKKFLKVLEKNGLTQQISTDKPTSKSKEIGVLILVIDSDPKKIYLCNLIINKIAKKLKKLLQKEFIKAIILHELYHILNKSIGTRDLNIYGLIKSEKKAHAEFKEDHPELAKVLREVKKKLKY